MSKITKAEYLRSRNLLARVKRYARNKKTGGRFTTSYLVHSNRRVTDKEINEFPIIVLFRWDKTPEGHAFWNAVDDIIQGQCI